MIEDFGVKFDYLDCLKKEQSIYKIIKYLKSKKIFKSKIFKKANQTSFIRKISKVYTYRGDWNKDNKNISDICFIKTGN